MSRVANSVSRSCSVLRPREKRKRERKISRTKRLSQISTLTTTATIFPRPIDLFIKLSLLHQLHIIAQIEYAVDRKSVEQADEYVHHELQLLPEIIFSGSNFN